MGRTKGFARHDGAYTDPHGSPKEMFVRPLRRDARARLADPADRPEWACPAVPAAGSGTGTASKRSRQTA